MARRGDGIYKRGKTWWMDIVVNGVRYQKRLGKGITRTVASELAAIERAKILRGEAGIEKKHTEYLFKEVRNRFETAWVS